jgi:hypothetical protein
MRTHDTHQVQSPRDGSTERNPITIDPLTSIEDIANILQVLSHTDAILIAKTQILSLDDISLEGDIPDNISLTKY